MNLEKELIEEVIDSMGCNSNTNLQFYLKKKQKSKNLQRMSGQETKKTNESEEEWKVDSSKKKNTLHVHRRLLTRKSVTLCFLPLDKDGEDLLCCCCCRREDNDQDLVDVEIAE